MAKINPLLQQDDDSRLYVCQSPDKKIYKCTLLELKSRMYELTKQFVLKHQSHYYKQFTGDPLDLASEFYIDFCTRKSRTPGQEQNLIDKYDYRVTSFEYLVKQAVIRKLIDCSRSDQFRRISIDKYLSDYGDSISTTFHLVSTTDETVDTREFSSIELEQAISSIESMPTRLQKHWFRQFLECRNVLAKSYRDLFDSVFTSIGFEI